MAESPLPPAAIRIGGVTVRGRSLTAEQGRSVALSIARALAERPASASASLDRVTLRVPASAIRADGTVDPAALSNSLGGRYG
jgi:hypothetical protein